MKVGPPAIPRCFTCLAVPFLTPFVVSDDNKRDTQTRRMLVLAVAGL